MFASNTNLHRLFTDLIAGGCQRQQQQNDGFTLIESLVALLVAALLLTGLSPMVALSIASRVQSRRIDLATQAARSYIDGLRSGVLTAPTNNNANFSASDLGVSAPTTLPSDPGTCFNPKDPNVTTTSDTNCTDESFVIQAFRDGATNAASAGYCVAVRVYRRDAFNSGGYPTQTDPTRTIFSAGAGSKAYPVVVMRTEIINQTSFEDYERRYKVNSSQPLSSSNSKSNSCNPPT